MHSVQGGRRQVCRAAPAAQTHPHSERVPERFRMAKNGVTDAQPQTGPHMRAAGGRLGRARAGTRVFLLFVAVVYVAGGRAGDARAWRGGPARAVRPVHRYINKKAPAVY